MHLSFYSCESSVLLDVIFGPLLKILQTFYAINKNNKNPLNVQIHTKSNSNSNCLDANPRLLYVVSDAGSYRR